MGFNSTPTDNLTWGDGMNLADFKAASLGQWFLGILDTANAKVYVLPSDVEPDDRYQQQLAVNGGTLIGKPKAPVPATGWSSKPLKGSQDYGINTAPSNLQGGMRQHVRMAQAYGANVAECLGFAVIKMTQDLAEFRDRSNSINDEIGKHADGNIARSPSGRSARMPADWSAALSKWLEAQLPVQRLQDTLMP